MKSVIVFACLLTVAYALPQIRDRDCPCQDYDKCTTIGSYDHTVCICPSGDKYLLSEEPYFNCTLPQLNPCTEDPCGNKAVCVAAQGGNAICICPFGYSGDPYVNCVKDCSDLPCGTNAECEVQHPSYVCKCPSGYSGDPYVNCTVNCTKHGLCGTNAECESKGTHTICNCLSGHKGDPYTGKEINKLV